MKCLVITPHRYGIREVAERVGSEWAAMGHEVDYELARGAAARIGPVTVGTPGIALWWYRTLRRVARGDAEYDLIWAHQPVAPVLPTRDAGFWDSMIVTFHTTLRAEYDLAQEGIYPRRLGPFHWVNKTLEARIYRSLEGLDADGPRYTVVAPHLREEIATFGIDEATYVPNGVMTPNGDVEKGIRGEFDIPEDATLVFNIGSLTPQKRADTCARVLRTVTEQDSEIYAVIAGKGPLADQIAAEAGDRMHVLGYISDEEKWRWFADADVFVSLAAYEGMPVASLEALSFGVPVVLSDIPAHRTVVHDHDGAGELVDAEPDDVLTGIRSTAGTRASIDLPDWRAIAEAYLDIARDSAGETVGPSQFDTSESRVWGVDQ